jgi:hypothetical protein
MSETPLDHAEDRKVQTINQFGLRIYSAKGYVIVIEDINSGRTQHVHVDPGAREFRGFIAAMEKARDHAIGRKAAAHPMNERQRTR